MNIDHSVPAGNCEPDLGTVCGREGCGRHQGSHSECSTPNTEAYFTATDEAEPRSTTQVLRVLFGASLLPSGKRGPEGFMTVWVECSRCMSR